MGNDGRWREEPLKLAATDGFLAPGSARSSPSFAEVQLAESCANPSWAADGASFGGLSAVLSPRMREIEETVKQLGLSDVPVLLTGETGVGKEMLAWRIHSCSRRAGAPFLKLNCAAFPSDLVESELFGYARGAFTGAFENRPGKFEMAHLGTVLLDEIGDMDVRLQAKLLQVLQDGEFLRLGGNERVRVDVRIIAATHCDLQQAIHEGRFRKDLFYRLNVVSIHIPALRERREEILWMAEYFLRKHAQLGASTPELSPTLCRAILEHHWPGNVRELENMMRRLLALGREDLLLRELGSQPAYRQAADTRPQPEPLLEPREELSLLKKGNLAKNQVEMEAILTALKATHWNRKQAAVLLGADYKTLLYKMKKLGIPNRQLSRMV